MTFEKSKPFFKKCLTDWNLQVMFSDNNSVGYFLGVKWQYQGLNV